MEQTVEEAIKQCFFKSFLNSISFLTKLLPELFLFGTHHFSLYFFYNFSFCFPANKKERARNHRAS